MGRSVGLGLAVTLLWAVSASAQDYERNGFYVGLGGSYVIENFGSQGPILGGVSNGGAGNARVGYRLHENASVEVMAEIVEGLDYSADSVVPDAWTVGVNGKAFLETGRVQPFLMVGMGMMRAEVPEREGEVIFLSADEDFAARFGAGLDVYEHEPHIAPELLAMPNVVCLPHIGSATMETRERMALTAARNVIACLEGREPPNPVN